MYVVQTLCGGEVGDLPITSYDQPCRCVVRGFYGPGRLLCDGFTFCFVLVCACFRVASEGGALVW